MIFERLSFSVFTKFFATHLLEGYTCTEDGGAAQTNASKVDQERVASKVKDDYLATHMA
jgi:hypothetical protein